MPQTDEFIPLSNELQIKLTKSPKSRALRAAVITSNPNKYAEFEEQLGLGYGLMLTQYQSEEIALSEQCLNIMKTCQYSPHFILRESSSLKGLEREEDLTEFSAQELVKRAGEVVKHSSVLSVYKPKWEERDGESHLIGFTKRDYEKTSFGYISNDQHKSCRKGFGWDALFINSATNLSNEEYFERYGKQSARQQVISDFIITYLRYKDSVALKHHSLPLGDNAIEFGNGYISLPRFIASEHHLSNPFINDWLIENLRNAMVNEGVFFKGAFSRAVKNYFSPPFSGLPLTAKKDDAEETIFLTHDTLHHLVQDLICDRPKEKNSYLVYAAWRMISEACTLVLADMLYADGLIRNEVDQRCVDSRIYPLFQQIKAIQNIPSPEELSKSEKIAFIKKLLEANVHYALLGDESKWFQLLTAEGESAPSVESLNALKAYTDHFGKFFIGDNAWTKANYENMHRNIERIHDWVSKVGKETFRKANIPLLSDVTNAIAKKGVSFNSYEEVVDQVFTLVFEQKITPHLLKDAVPIEEETLIQSKAFRRFLIGQCSILSRYPKPLNLEQLELSLYRRLGDEKPFTHKEQDDYRRKLAEFINGVMGLGLMTHAEAKNAKDCAPVFPPVYISYPAMQEKYGSIDACVRETIFEFSEHFCEERTKETENPYVKVINGITFIDAIALEDAIDGSKPVSDFLRQKMILAGVSFWDEEKTIVKKPMVGISAIGGFSVCLSKDLPLGTVQLRLGKTCTQPIAIEDLKEGLEATMGMQSAYSYQNPNQKSAEELYKVTAKHGHFSIAHGASLGITMLGLSKKAELELTSQRDLVHEARVTSARAACQDSPCLVAMTENGARVSKRVKAQIDEELASFAKEGSALDFREERNAIFPLSAAQSIGVNGSLRNLQKLVKDIGGSGKEKEYRNLLALLNDSLHAFFPSLFQQSKDYSHQYPENWNLAEITDATRVVSLGLFKSSKQEALCDKPSLLLLGAPKR